MNALPASCAACASLFPFCAAPTIERRRDVRSAGMTRVIVPQRNVRDVQAEVPPDVLEALKVIPTTCLEQVLAAAFDPPLLLLPHSRL